MMASSPLSATPVLDARQSRTSSSWGPYKENVLGKSDMKTLKGIS
jgi:hypothetical protein